ncbi:MAG: isoaspartyl peptidase/L-asparaginase [Halovenus sp.]
MKVLAHGGAGGSDPAEPERRQTVLDQAVAAGRVASDPVSAVVITVSALERDPRFNAGTGGAVQSDGRVRTDAGLMTGDGTTGAACAMPGVEAAVEVARAVATETPHVLLAGERAVGFADTVGVDTDCDLTTERTRERWADVDPPDSADPADHLAWVREQFGGSDTVGAVATDGQRVAAATSTGGRWCALAGRVGDVPQVGSGFYATETAAVSTTGAGESIARFGLARRVAEAIGGGDDPQTAADRLIRGFATETGAHAGVIALDREGRTGDAFNSDGMQTARSL